MSHYDQKIKECIIELRLAWWFVYLYVPGILFFCKLLRKDFNEEKFSYWLKKAIIQRNRGIA